MRARVGCVLGILAVCWGCQCSDSGHDDGDRGGTGGGTVSGTGGGTVSGTGGRGVSGTGGGAVGETGGAASVSIPETPDDPGYIFEDGLIRTYEVTLTEQDLARVNASPAAEQYVPAQLHFDGQTYDVGYRYKGSIAAFMSPCTQGWNYKTAPKGGKCSVKLSFNWVDPEGRFYGLKKLQFHSMNADASFLRERLSYSLFRDMGVPASQVVYARLVVNGVEEGLFALVEEIDGRFTRARFPDGGEGNLYKEIWPIWQDSEVYLNALETNEDENPSVDKMVRFKDAVLTGPEAMASWLDVDALLSYLAVDRVIMNDDGMFHFWCAQGAAGNNPQTPANHNYFWYEATDADRMWLIPWDLEHAINENYMVGGSRGGSIHVEFDWTQPAPSCSCTRTSQAPAACDPMIQNLQTWLDAYQEQVDAFIAGPFSAENVDAKLAAWQAELDPAVAETAGKNGAPSYQQWQEAMADLAGIIERARENRGYPYGTSGTGGTGGTGGTSDTGGTSGTGGTSDTGGSSDTGGASPLGGAGGAAGSEPTTGGTAGTAGTHETPESGGTSAAGGSAGSAGVQGGQGGAPGGGNGLGGSPSAGEAGSPASGPG